MKRSEARALGLKRYHSARPCPYGHGTERYVSTGGCCICVSAHAVKWKKENIEWTRAYARARYWDDPLAMNAKTREWFANNPERARELRQAWHLANPLARRLHEEVRRARKKASAGSVTPKDIDALRVKQKHKCVYCNVSIRRKFHIDHIMPIALGGAHDISNMQLLCPSCNHRKHVKHPLEFAKTLGRLL